VTAALALVALVVVGFLCGALAGFLWEEPGLVIAYLSGETEAVEWTEPGAVAAPPPSEAAEKMPMGPTPTTPAPDVKPAPEPEQVAKAAPPPTPVPAAKTEPAPKPAAKPASAPVKPAAKPVAAAPPGRYAVQVGAFAESDAAETLAERLRGRGYTSYVLASTDGDSRWRVRVGPVAERSAAEALATKLEKNEKLPTWVLDEGEG
jgi:cell division septation protein DedD